MPNPRRRLSVAAIAAFILAATSSGLAAQETTNTVGPPQLKDFSLPGQRTTPPVQQQPPVRQPAPQPTTSAPARPVPSATPPSTQPAPATVRREPRSTERPAPAAAPASRPADAAQRPATPPAAATVPAATPAPVSPSLSGPSIVPVAPAPAAATPTPSSPINWLWIGGAALLALLAFFGLRRFNAMRADSRRRALREERAAVRAAETVAAPEPVAPETVAAVTGPRARLELSFTAERAVATDSETIVDYEMVLRNIGQDIARNIRIDVRMFNAGAKSAISGFLKGPIHDQSGSPQVTIAPGAELKLTSSIAMPKDEVKGIEVQGRSIFVPIVAINTAYDWGSGEASGTGRTARSWLVGREPQAPSDKMGAFRLDLGPRIYRSVGQRPTELANVA